MRPKLLPSSAQNVSISTATPKTATAASLSTSRVTVGMRMIVLCPAITRNSISDFSGFPYGVVNIQELKKEKEENEKKTDEKSTKLKKISEENGSGAQYKPSKYDTDDDVLETWREYYTQSCLEEREKLEPLDDQEERVENKEDIEKIHMKELEEALARKTGKATRQDNLEQERIKWIAIEGKK
ncbi:hypothetical protein ILUMI_09198 [Ignelater luminosus]|uniref:Uncharacterized protein n=1 Tax=Ignelater luminosus TaxID=2038154 RepID=A0A8K0D680_IGNLU|nr:hypothetical protein ILUMI_09198 [Ignelater luminosus]